MNEYNVTNDPTKSIIKKVEDAWIQQCENHFDHLARPEQRYFNACKNLRGDNDCHLIYTGEDTAEGNINGIGIISYHSAHRHIEGPTLKMLDLTLSPELEMKLATIQPEDNLQSTKDTLQAILVTVMHSISLAKNDYKLSKIKLYIPHSSTMLGITADILQNIGNNKGLIVDKQSNWLVLDISNFDNLNDNN